MRQNRESYHNITIRRIGSNLTELSSCVDEMKMIYYPVHKGIYEKEMAYSLVAAKKTTHLPQIVDLTMPELKNANPQMTIDKWARRWANFKFHKDKKLVPTICKNTLKHRLFHLQKQLERGSSHCILK